MSPHTQEIPLAPAVFRRTKGGPAWCVPVCPICGEHHTHRPEEGQEPRELLGAPTLRRCSLGSVLAATPARYALAEAPGGLVLALRAAGLIARPWAVLSASGDLLRSHRFLFEAFAALDRREERAPGGAIVNLRVELLRRLQGEGAR